MGGVRWTEQLRGHLSFDQTDFNQALMEGRRDGVGATLRLSLQIDDVDAFARAAHKRAWVTRGHLDCPALQGLLPVSWGAFELLGQANELLDHLHLRMRYRLNLRDPAGRELRLAGFKLVENDPGNDSWPDTTTLFTRIYTGRWSPSMDGQHAGEHPRGVQDEHPSAHAAAQPGPPHPWAEPGEHARGDGRAGLVATGVLQISGPGFLRELCTFRGTRGSGPRQLRDVLRFGACFAGGVAKAYVGTPITDGRSSFPRDYPRLPADRTRTEAWHRVPGREREEQHARHALEREIIPLPVKDLSFPLNLHHIRIADRDPGPNGPVLLAHGAGVRAEMFYGQPQRETIVDHLLERGYDVWLLNWRGSIDLPNVSYTLDEVARFDHPAAVQKVYEVTGKKLRALVHCQGSVSFMMAAVAGLLPTDPDTGEQLVTHVVSSAISLFFEVPDRTWLKQRAMMPLVRRLGTGADPQWGIRAINAAGAALARVSRSAERPCGNVPCQVASYIYGAGWDVLLCHDNLDDDVHAWTARELGYTPFSLIGQVAESCRYGHIVPAQPREARSPATYVELEPRIEGVRFTLLGCTRDTMFEPAGQQRTATFLAGAGLEADYVPLEGYGHMDAYWGKDAATDVFPSIGWGLEWRDEAGRPSRRLTERRPQVDLGPAGRVPAFDLRKRVRERYVPSLAFHAPPPPRSRVP